MQKELFDQPKNTPSPRGSIIRIKQTGAPLSKEQQTFNRLIKRIGNLQKQLEDDTAKMEELHKLYQGELIPHVTELSRLKIEICHLLDEKRQTVKLTHIQQNKLDELVIDFLDDALRVSEPDEPTQQLFKKYNNTTFGETQQQIDETEKDLFREMFYEQFGLDIDPDLLTDNPDFEKITASLEQQLNEKDRKNNKRRKTKKQQEKEAIAQQEQELKNKSLRSIYLSLAKLLHPDAEVDITLKHEKEELMKQVTIAYNNHDMLRLLQLEMQWVKSHEEELNRMNDHTLTIYLQLLKDQVKDLETERDMLFFSPKYGRVANYYHTSITIAKAGIRKDAEEYRELNDAIRSDIESLQKGNRNHAVIRDCIHKYYRAGFNLNKGKF